MVSLSSPPTLVRRDLGFPLGISLPAPPGEQAGPTVEGGGDGGAAGASSGRQGVRDGDRPRSGQRPSQTAGLYPDREAAFQPRTAGGARPLAGAEGRVSAGRRGCRPTVSRDGRAGRGRVCTRPLRGLGGGWRCEAVLPVVVRTASCERSALLVLAPRGTPDSSGPSVRVPPQAQPPRIA